MRTTLEIGLRRIWAGRGVVAWMLLPVALLFGTLTRLRWLMYRWQILKSQRVPAVVVVVGNVVAGGAGKTPTTISLVEHLLNRGLKVGVVSRGYGRSDHTCLEVFPHAEPAQVGDEPLLIKSRTNVPVFVGNKRRDAALALLESYPQTQIVVCDDGLQHFSLHRDIEVCVFDNRGCGNEWLMPAGPLRESWPRRNLPAIGQHLHNILILHTGSRPAFAGYTGKRRLADYGLQSNGDKLRLANLGESGAAGWVAIAGTSQPEEFFSMLTADGVLLEQTVALPDHYNFDDGSWLVHADQGIICTEKDAKKLWRIAPNAIAVPLLFEIEPAFLSRFDTLINAALSAKLSSGHGHTTT